MCITCSKKANNAKFENFVSNEKLYKAVSHILAVYFNRKSLMNIILTNRRIYVGHKVCRQLIALPSGDASGFSIAQFAVDLE